MLYDKNANKVEHEANVLFIREVTSASQKSELVAKRNCNNNQASKTLFIMLVPR